MSSLFLLAGLIAVLGDNPEAAARRPSDQTVQPRRFHQIDADIREALRAEAVAETDQQRSQAVRKMVAIYRELKKDPRLETSDTLKRYKAKLWSRMMRVKRELEQRIAREARMAKDKKDKGDQQEFEAVEQAAGSLATQMSMMNYTMGGPSYVLEQSGGAFGGGTSFDHSQELIDLIQRTIKPDFWDVNGGPGSMFYYRPLMALVVRATSEVHGDVGGLLRAMRQAGP